MGIQRKHFQTGFWAVVFYTAFTGPAQADSREYEFPDGVRIKVHFQEAALKAAGAERAFVEDVLDAAVSAYQTLTEFEGFRTPGYAFASPDRRYAYDPDRRIDVYLGDPEGGNWFEELGAKNKLFRDAPCFDTRLVGPGQYEAVILLPTNYEEFIRNWEKMNPSSLGKRDARVDLRGTLIHEMTHVILFYYNKNLDKAGVDAGSESSGEALGAGKRLDWYVEGLARYFETFAGARHDFYSQGFKQTLPDKIRFSRGGSNYFMRYPDQAFTELRYENALFWRFIDTRFGMPAIEALSRRLRGHSGDFKKALEEATRLDFDTLLTQYASAVLLGDFGLKEDGVYLHEVASTRLWVEQDALYLLDAQQNKKALGAVCRTDWIGHWQEARAAHGEPSVAGDATEAADVSAWATDFVELRFAPSGDVPELSLKHSGAGRPLAVQTYVFTRGGSVLQSKPFSVRSGSARSLVLTRTLRSQSLGAADLERVVVALTNTDPDRAASYEISL